MKLELSQTKLIILTALFIVALDNFFFFTKVFVVYPITKENFSFLLSLAIVFCCVLVLLFRLLSSRFTTKPILIFSLISASAICYFTNSYHIIIDDEMIQNIVETNVAESLDLMSVKLFVYIAVLGLLPSWLVYKTKITKLSFKREAYSRLTTIVVCIALIAAALVMENKFYASFLREHKPLRFNANPIYSFYSAGKYLGKHFFTHQRGFQQIGLDAKIERTDPQPKLIIMVVGEAVRADHFSLNGYERETNPLLKQLDIINLPNVSSCGTSTAISVPCMFSILQRENYDGKVAQTTENVLDVLQRAGVKVLWRENNSSSKGVADRVSSENYRTKDKNTMCTADGECRDEGMLVGLQQFIDSNAQEDMLIVLHQMGNHGPAYFKRYPESFEQFIPVCTTNELQECSAATISNAYDNAILYTDYFLAQTIELLKQNNSQFQTAMLYMSDHGESLGENGLYLHGLPYMMAPDAQTHVAALMWFGEAMRAKATVNNLKQHADSAFSHDNLFHTLLGIFEVKSSVYTNKLDMLNLHTKQP